MMCDKIIIVKIVRIWKIYQSGLNVTGLSRSRQDGKRHGVRNRGKIRGRQDGETLRRRSIANRSDSELRSQMNASGGPKEASSSSVHHNVTRQKTVCEHRTIRFVLSMDRRRAHP